MEIPLHVSGSSTVDIFLWEEWMDVVGERKCWITNLMW